MMFSHRQIKSVSFFLCFLSVSALEKVQKLISVTPSSTQNILPNEYGIGFDFSVTYGTAAISWANGSTFAVTLVPGNEEYRDLMHRVSLQAYRHLAPPYGEIDEWFRDLPRQEWRKFRKRLGLPASNDARIIGNMAKALKSKTEDFLGHPITRSAASFPKFVALYDEEVWDGFQWANIEHQRVILQHSALTRQVSSLYAAGGFGLCSNYKNTTSCVKEIFGKETWDDSIVTVFYSTNALIVEFPQMVNAYLYVPPWDGQNIHNFTLGFGAAATLPGYWQILRDSFEEFFDDFDWVWRGDPPTKIFVTGESALEDKFLEVLTEACSRRNNTPVYYANDILFMAAKGTAELGKRAEYLDWQNLHSPYPTPT